MVDKSMQKVDNELLKHKHKGGQIKTKGGQKGAASCRYKKYH